MDIKSKKSDLYIGENSFVNKVFSKPFRILAVVLACIFFGISVVGYNFAGELGIDDFEPEYTESEAYHNNVMAMYEQLCVLSACYLNNVDSSWNFTGEKNLLDDFIYYLDYNGYKYKKTDKGIKPVSSLFDYYVSYEDEDGEIRYVTNINYSAFTHENMSDDERINWLKENLTGYILRRNNVITSDNVSSGNILYYTFPTAESGYYDGEYTYFNNVAEESFSDNFVPVGGWYYDNYGRYFYNFGNEEPIRFFDSPKNTDRGEIARNGYIDIYLDTETGEEIPSFEFENREGYYEYDWYSEYLEDTTGYEAYYGTDSGITVFISPKQEVVKNAAASYASIVSTYKHVKIGYIASIIFTVILLLYLTAACGYTVNDENKLVWSKPKFFGDLSVELYLVLGFFILCFDLFILNYSFEICDTINVLFGTKYVGMILYSVLCSVLVFPLIFISIQIIEKFKTRTFISNLLTVKIYKKIKNAYLSSEAYKHYQQLTMGQKFTRRSIKVLVSCISVPIFLLLCFGFDDVWLFGCVIAFVVVLVCEIKNIKNYKDLSKISRQIKLIGTDEPFEENISDKSAVYNDSVMLTQISEKVKSSVEEQIKSERMKIELVANVSHDLKTPLTSIISYIDLLKKLDLDDEAKSYVEILDRKSQKLKSIVYDVFSLAKATSGIDVNLAELDFVILFNQVLADSDDKLKSSGKIIKTDIYEKSAYVMADGDKLYRVFQNLVDNALNYSLEGSRIFLEIRREKDNIQFISKNIASYPIDFTAEEIVERFVRGDKSRTDGGSGLGLSIAKSFTEACGGEFIIELDGDMFKSIVSLPILKKDEQDNAEKESSDDDIPINE